MKQLQDGSIWRVHGISSEVKDWYLTPLHEPLYLTDLILLDRIKTKQKMSALMRSDLFSAFGIRRLQAHQLLKLQPVKNDFLLIKEDTNDTTITTSD
jgi:hypothetical protein